MRRRVQYAIDSNLSRTLVGSVVRRVIEFPRHRTKIVLLILHMIEFVRGRGWGFSGVVVLAKSRHVL
jgi:hypothetical protein